MRLEWLEDILAVMETGSFVRAAERRFLTQPAFSRRIKLIENHLGVELFDRSKRPVELKQTILDQQFKIRELAAGLRELSNDLKRQDRETQNRILIASQHAITASFAPSLVRKLSIKGSFNTRLHSANRDECFSMLLAKQVDFILVHQTKNEQIPDREGFLEQSNLTREQFIPVYATNELQRFKKEFEKGDISVIAYPSDVFLGQVVNQEVFAHLWHSATIHKKAETALTLAVLPLALMGVGVAWLPHSLVASDLDEDKLTDLSNILPSCELSVVAIRLKHPNSTSNDIVWDIITAYSESTIGTSNSDAVNTHTLD